MRNSRRAAPPPTHEPLFFAFEQSPPDAQQCLDAIYRLFDAYDVPPLWCPQCFSSGEQRIVASIKDRRSAAFSAFSMIYHEHTNCSGGINTFKAMLGRGIELGFFRDDYATPFAEQVARCDVLIWPSEEQQALRQLFSRVAINWFLHDDTAPLQVIWSDEERKSYSSNVQKAFINKSLIYILCALRIDAYTLFSWMLKADTSIAWHALLNAIQSPHIVEPPFYFDVNDGTREATVCAAAQALDRHTRDALFRVVTPDVVERKWLEDSEDDLHLAVELEKVDALWGAWQFSYDDATRQNDENAIRLALQP